MPTASLRPTSWWLEILRRRTRLMNDETAGSFTPIHFASEEERRAAIKFFNAAVRAEQSGLNQAKVLSNRFAETNPSLAEALRLYGNEEGWHEELLHGFIGALGGEVTPMGPVTRVFYGLYARAKRTESIVLTNLMFETIGSATYRMALGRVTQPEVRRMLTILARDEAFHVPLNVHFLRNALADTGFTARLWTRILYHLLFVSLVALPVASRPKARAFDRLGVVELARVYARALATLFQAEPDLPFRAPQTLLWALGVKTSSRAGSEPSVVSEAAAVAAAERKNPVLAID